MMIEELYIAHGRDAYCTAVQQSCVSVQKCGLCEGVWFSPCAPWTVAGAVGRAV